MLPSSISRVERKPSAPVIRRGIYRTITSGIVFAGLRIVAVDPKIDPPHGHCCNCWHDGHLYLICIRAIKRPFCRSFRAPRPITSTGAVPKKAKKPKKTKSSRPTKEAPRDAPTKESDARDKNRSRGSSPIERDRLAKRRSEDREVVMRYIVVPSDPRPGTSRGVDDDNLERQRAQRLFDSLQDAPPEVRGEVLRRFYGVPKPSQPK